MAFKTATKKAILRMIQPSKSIINLLQVKDKETGTIFWTTQPPTDKTEKVIKVKTFPYPMKEGLYGEDYLSGTDIWAIKKELKELK